MKKILLTTVAVVLGAVGSYAQGLVSINSGTASIAYTNNAGTLGKVSGTATYVFELLISANTQLSGSASNITSSANLALWSDSTVSANNGTGLSAGRIGGGTSVSATGWAAPGASYDNPMSVLLVGWDTAHYANWAAVATAINGSGLAAGTWFGTSVIGVNVAGGGASSLNAVNLWGNQTGTLGYGWPNAVNGTPNITLNQVAAVPEPSTLVLAGLGGLSLLAFRRKK